MLKNRSIKYSQKEVLEVYLLILFLQNVSKLPFLHIWLLKKNPMVSQWEGSLHWSSTFFVSPTCFGVHLSTRRLLSSGLSPCKRPLLCWTIAPLLGHWRPLQEQLWHLLGRREKGMTILFKQTWKWDTWTLSKSLRSKSTGSPKVEPGTNILLSDPDDFQICVKAEASVEKKTSEGQQKGERESGFHDLQLLHHLRSTTSWSRTQRPSRQPSRLAPARWTRPEGTDFPPHILAKGSGEAPAWSRCDNTSPGCRTWWLARFRA